MGRLDERDAVESGPSRTSTGWPFVILGVAAVTVGLLMMLYGRETIGTIILLFAAALGVWGLRQIVATFGAAEPTDRAIRLFFGFAAVAGAVIFLFGAKVSLPLLRILAGGSLAVWGALDATESFLRPGGRWWVTALRGVSLVAVGLAIVFVAKTVDLLAVLLGLALVWWGLVEVMLGLLLGRASRGGA
jgi:uncharacterized membrane protein HdeD (DUF308 family)